VNHLGSAIRLVLQRDMGKPVDVLEIEGHATVEQVHELERMMCNDVPYLGQFCSLEGNQDIGKVTGTTGETLQSYPLALTQLLITYHMLKAAEIGS
jgi:phosphoribulokinase